MYVCMYLFIPIFMPLLLLELSIFVHLVIYLPGYDNAHTQNDTCVCIFNLLFFVLHTKSLIRFFFLLLFFNVIPTV